MVPSTFSERHMSADTFFEEPRVLDTLVAFDEDRSTGDLIIKRSQEIDDDWLSDVSTRKIDSKHTPAGDFYQVASVPVAVVDELMRLYGFDFMNAPARECLKMLDRYAFDNFITTTKRI